jgi:hypothetical protein
LESGKVGQHIPISNEIQQILLILKVRLLGVGAAFQPRFPFVLATQIAAEKPLPQANRRLKSLINAKSASRVWLRGITLNSPENFYAILQAYCSKG